MKLGRRIVPASLTQRALAIVLASPVPVSSAQLGNDLGGLPSERVSALMRKHVEKGTLASQRVGRINYYTQGTGVPVPLRSRHAAARPVAGDEQAELPVRQRLVSAIAAPPVATTGVPSVFALGGAAEEPQS